MELKRYFKPLHIFSATSLCAASLLLSANVSAYDGDSSFCPLDASLLPHSQTPRPDDLDFKSSSNCVFHQWSWQMFLWLTQEVDGEPRFLGFNSPQSLLGMEQRGLLPRMTKSHSAESMDEYLQAGTDGILVDRKGRAVYYSQYINPTFEHFITDNELTNPENVRAMDPNTTFPIDKTTKAGSMELKASWKIVEEGEDVSGMFTMETEVAQLENSNNGIVINPDKTENVTVALVGFHIGGVVNGHPEMIWATFEHNNNAPNVAPGSVLETVVSEEDFTFYSAGTILGECNQNPAMGWLKLDEENQLLSPTTDVCRLFEYGSATTDGDFAGNTRSIKSINASAADQLASSDVWSNYYEVGAVWFLEKNALEPGLSLATDSSISPTGNAVDLTGSLKLSNSVVETFTQTQSAMNNCFRCHNTLQELPPKMSLAPLPATNLNISHAFQNIYFWSQEMDN